MSAGGIKARDVVRVRGFAAVAIQVFMTRNTELAAGAGEGLSSSVFLMTSRAGDAAVRQSPLGLVIANFVTRFALLIHRRRKRVAEREDRKSTRLNSSHG